jgi:proteic killer suppression protein
MHIESIRHKGLRQLYEDNNAKGVHAWAVGRLRKLLFAMDTATGLDDLAVFPGWRLHPLKGDLSGFWSLTVTCNWRLVFQYDAASNTARILDLIDYH